MPQGWTIVPEPTAPPQGWTRVQDAPTVTVLVNGQPMSIEDYNATQQGSGDPQRDQIHRLFQQQGPIGLDDYAAQGPRRIVQGVRELVAGNGTRGAHDVIAGAGATSAPFVGPAALRHKLATGAAVLAGSGGAQLATRAATAAGATPDQAALAGDAGAVVGGAAGGWMGNAAARVPARAAVNVAARGARAVLKPREALLATLEKVIQATKAEQVQTAPTVTVVDTGAPPAPAPDRTIRGYLNGSTAREMPASSLPDPSYVRAVPAQYPGRETPPVAQEPPYDPAAAQASARADTARVVEQARSRWASQRPPAPAVPQTSPPPTPRASGRTPAAALASVPGTAGETQSAAVASFDPSQMSEDDIALGVRLQEQGKTGPEIIQAIVKARADAARIGGVPSKTMRARIKARNETGRWADDQPNTVID